MQHPDPEDLSLLALASSDGTAPPDQLPALPPDGVDPVVVEHVRGCAQCSAEVTQLARIAWFARSEDADDWAPPADRVWDAITAELGMAGQPADPPAHGGRSAAPVAPVALPTPAAPAGPQADRRTAPRPRRWGVLVAASVVGALVGGAIVWGITRSGSTPAPAPAVAATATLLPVPGGPGQPGQTGQAELLDTAVGPQLQVTSSELPPVHGAYEVWLLGPDGRMVSLGVLDEGTGKFTVPGGIDTGEYKIVDISDEPPDGVPTHSGKSVLRGTLS